MHCVALRAHARAHSSPRNIGVLLDRAAMLPSVALRRPTSVIRLYPRCLFARASLPLQSLTLLHSAALPRVPSRAMSAASAVHAEASERAGPLETRIRAACVGAFAPTYLEIVNESGKHNVPRGSETHFKVRARTSDCQWVAYACWCSAEMLPTAAAVAY